MLSSPPPIASSLLSPSSTSEPPTINMLICLKFIITFPSVALVAALLAGGALLAHVDPYGEVPIKLCHHLSIICHRLTNFCHHLTIICHRLTNCCHHLTIICHYLYQYAAVPSLLLLGSWGKALLWEWIQWVPTFLWRTNTVMVNCKEKSGWDPLCHIKRN